MTYIFWDLFQSRSAFIKHETKSLLTFYLTPQDTLHLKLNCIRIYGLKELQSVLPIYFWEAIPSHPVGSVQISPWFRNIVVYKISTFWVWYRLASVCDFIYIYSYIVTRFQCIFLARSEKNNVYTIHMTRTFRFAII